MLHRDAGGGAKVVVARRPAGEIVFNGRLAFGQTPALDGRAAGPGQGTTDGSLGRRPVDGEDRRAPTAATTWGRGVNCAPSVRRALTAVTAQAASMRRLRAEPAYSDER